MTQIRYKELREKVTNAQKYPGCIKIDRSPLINECYPGKFNLSFTEYPWIKRFGRYMNFDSDYIFSTVQSCIRWNDIYDEDTGLSNLEGKDSWKYLGVFEMASPYGMIALKGRQNAEDLQKVQLKSLIDIFESIGIEKKQIFPSYQKGRKLQEVTKWKYNLDFDVPEDSLARKLFIEAGIPQENLVQDYGRDTFISVKLEREDPRGKGSIRIPTPWGYRNEININIGTPDNPKLIDVATIERINWTPIYDSNWNLLNLVNTNDEVSVGAIGLERLCMVANNQDRVQDIDCIKPFYETLGTANYLAGESLRALHRIYSDISKFGLSLHKGSRRRRINRIIQNILAGGLNSEQIRKSLDENSQIQPWHTELEAGIEPTLTAIEEYKKKIKK